MSHDWKDEAANTSQRLLERNPFLSYIGPKGTCRFQQISQFFWTRQCCFFCGWFTLRCRPLFQERWALCRCSPAPVLLHRLRPCDNLILGVGDPIHVAGRFTLYRNTSLNASLYVVLASLSFCFCFLKWLFSYTEADESLDIVFLDARHDYEAPIMNHQSYKQSFQQWKKTWLFRVYRGLYYKVRVFFSFKHDTKCSEKKRAPRQGGVGWCDGLEAKSASRWNLVRRRNSGNGRHSAIPGCLNLQELINGL